MCVHEATVLKGKNSWDRRKNLSGEILLWKNKMLEVKSEDLRSGWKHLEEDLECFVSTVELLEGFDSYGIFMAW